jgi:hypothetical protein
MGAASIKGILKKIAFAIMPQKAEEWQQEHRRRHIQQWEESLGLPQLAKDYIAHHGLEVKRGLFAGMQYNPEASGSVLVPKLLGSYEAELEDTIISLLERGYSAVVDIGCAEGYYAVGLARRMPGVSIYAYDTNPHAQKLCLALAELNNVSSQVKVRGTAEFAQLTATLGTQKTLVVCDCDGCESFILDPEKLPSLSQTDVLVEVHDYLDETITPTLRRRFESTHEIQYIASVMKDPTKYPELNYLSPEDQQKVINEYRPQQGWLIMTTKKV